MTRIFRGGGLTKDAFYLRGLVEVLKLLRSGGNIDLLLVGKVALSHLPVIRELEARELLRPVSVRPCFLADPKAFQRLERIQDGLSVSDLIKEAGRPARRSTTT